MKGILVKIATLSDGSVRFSVDVPKEIVPDDVMKWAYQEVEIIYDRAE